jgi:endo-1,3-1,4-beta-glycanase ExoK
VKDSGTSTYGPGTNYWSPSTDNVWVDSLDNLHLKITKVGARWYCAEVIMVDNAFGQPGFLGYGTYRWTTASHVATLDPNVVLGLFQWDDQSDATTVAQGHREIDIELSRWGKAGDHRNGQYVLEPYDSGPLQKFVLPDAATNTFQYTWAPGVLDWSVPTASPATYHYAGGFVPDASGQQQPRMNLWLNNSKSPKSGKPVEVVLSDFTFIAG